MKPGVLFLNFGGPTKDEELEPFLRELLGDVLPGPRWLARALGARLAPLRAKRVRENYRMIGWSPLVAETTTQAEAVAAALGDEMPPWATAMMFTPPFAEEGLRALLDQGVERVLVVGLYPHWSFATSGSAYDMVHRALQALGRADLPVHYARAFFDDPLYVEAVAATIQRGRAELPGEGPVHLLFSAHGVPVSFVKEGDPYPDHVRASVRHVVEHLGWEEPWSLAWQSRVGPVRWLEPNTEEAIPALARQGVQRLLTVPVSFVGEHIETLHEIDIEYAELAHASGIPHVGRAPALGHEPAFIACLAGQIRDGLARFGKVSCSRCLLPQGRDHGKTSPCPNCAFRFPQHVRELGARSGIG